MSPTTPNANPNPPTWVEIKKSVLNYQAYLRSLSVPAELKRKAFVLDKEIIDRLFQLGSGSPKAIRLYIGSEPDGTGLRLFPVACEQKTDASGRRYYEDIDIPRTLSTDDTVMRSGDTADMSTSDTTSGPLPPPEETRPCPSDCSTSNFLNPTP